MHDKLFFLSALLLISCSGNKQDKGLTPWGQVVTEEGIPEETADTIGNSETFSLSDIINAGELIMLTISSPETYYDYHGHGMGLHYMMCEKLSQEIGVSLRVELCKDSLEMIEKLRKGEGDIVCYPISKKEIGKGSDFVSCGMKDDKGLSWIVRKSNEQLASRADEWFKPEIIAKTRKEMTDILTTGYVKRHVYPFMISRKDAIISKYDYIFRKYAPVAGCDWTLIAAQCYQESCFDPNAKSWAGACGLMQIIPSTASHLGLPLSDIYSPEANVSAACRYMKELQGMFSEVDNRKERINFALASYNGGYYHIKDAMALAKKYGKNPHRWSDVREFVLGLQSPQYYKDPVVKHGYMRGSETAGYVDKIIERWDDYRSATRGKFSSGTNAMPSPAKHKNKWDKN